MDELFAQLTASFDIELAISITLFSYILIKGLEKLKYKTSTSVKRIIVGVLSIVLCYIYYKYVGITLESIIPTYLISVVGYDYIIKFIISKLRIDYKK